MKASVCFSRDNVKQILEKKKKKTLRRTRNDAAISVNEKNKWQRDDIHMLDHFA